MKYDVTEKRQISSGRFFSNFVAFSKYPNFSKTEQIQNMTTIFT